MWAKLYGENNGNEEQAKVAYIRKRVDQLVEFARNQKLEAEYFNKKNKHISDETIRQIVSKEYKQLTHWSTEYFKLENGEFALKTTPVAAPTTSGKFAMYVDENSIRKSIEHLEKLNRYNLVGLLKTVDISDFIEIENNVKKIITCRKCKQKIRVENKTATVKCSSCFHKWLYEVEPI